LLNRTSTTSTTCIARRPIERAAARGEALGDDLNDTAGNRSLCNGMEFG
jgi:hypothetical protein